MCNILFQKSQVYAEGLWHLTGSMKRNFKNPI